jgi:hypothetical protein
MKSKNNLKKSKNLKILLTTPPSQPKKIQLVRILLLIKIRKIIYFIYYKSPAIVGKKKRTDYGIYDQKK